MSACRARPLYRREPRTPCGSTEAGSLPGIARSPAEGRLRPQMETPWDRYKGCPSRPDESPPSLQLRGRSWLELLPPVLLLKPTAEGHELESILRHMVSESALARPGQRVALSRLTEVLFVEVLRSWIKSLRPGEGGWLGAMADPHIGPALQLIHEQPDQPWTLRDLGHRVGLGRSAFSARFSSLVGHPMQRYLIARRMAEAAFLLESSDEAIARIANQVGYETATAFSKLFQRHHGLSPGRYRAARRL